MLQLLLGPISELLGKVIDRAIPDKAQAEAMKLQALQEIMAAGGRELDAQMRIVLAEAQGESWMQRNWRPVLMLAIVAIVAHNYLIAPYLAAMGLVSMQLALPDRLWDLMTLGVGGYVVGRTGEKMMDTYVSAKR